MPAIRITFTSEFCWSWFMWQPLLIYAQRKRFMVQNFYFRPFFAVERFSCFISDCFQLHFYAALFSCNGQLLSSFNCLSQPLLAADAYFIFCSHKCLKALIMLAYFFSSPPCICICVWVCLSLCGHLTLGSNDACSSHFSPERCTAARTFELFLRCFCSFFAMV